MGISVIYFTNFQYNKAEEQRMVDPVVRTGPKSVLTLSRMVLVPFPGWTIRGRPNRDRFLLRCSCLIRGHPWGGLCLPIILLCAELDPYTKRGGAAHPV